MSPQPPRPARRPVSVTRHGRTLVDEYGWLRDADWQHVMREPDTLDSEIRAHLEAENAYTEAVLAPVAELRADLVRELRARIKEDDSTVPAPDGAFEYYRRFDTGGQYPIFCRRPHGDRDAEQVLLDGPEEAAGHDYFRVAACRHSPDHARLAYAVDNNGSEYYRIGVRDLATGEETDAAIERAQGDLVWAADGATLFHTLLDDNHRPWRVMRHRLGTAVADDVLVYEEGDAGFTLGVGATEDRRFIVIAVHDHAQTAELRLVDAATPDAAPRLIAPREIGIDYDVASHGERLFVRTNADGAIDFKICEVPLDAPGRANWRDVIGHREGRLIRAMLVFADHLVRLEREDGLARIVVRRLADGDEHTIAFDEAVYELGLVPGYEFDTTTLRFSYSSLATPERIYDYDMATRARTLRKAQEIPSGHDPADYVAARVFATSHDGASVPVSLFHHKDTALDGSAPALLYGYGSYGFAMPAGFSPHRLSLADRGFVYAIAHIRGGTDKGYGWYHAGKLMNKRNTFADFIAAAEHLIAADHTSAGRIAAHGGSAGGLLVGAAANLRPDLFGAIVGEVPFVDVLTTMCDDTLPLTPPEWVEWGNPIADADAFAYMASYSPYDNIARQAYPAILATAGLTDPRVTYWEPAKWVARLRDRTTGIAPILLHTNMGAGHGGASGRFDRLAEVALVYAFILQVLGRAD